MLSGALAGESEQAVACGCVQPESPGNEGIHDGTYRGYVSCGLGFEKHTQGAPCSQAELLANDARGAFVDQNE